MLVGALDWEERKSMRKIAYFSMEMALESEMRTYAGGLGILAGDTLRSAAGLNLPLCGVTLLHRRGYFRQRLDESGWQFEDDDGWEGDRFLTEMEPRVEVHLHNRKVWVRCWQYEVEGSLPVYLLDTDLEENGEWDRRLTDRLYLGDHYLRICQEAVLGIGGVKMLRALGHKSLVKFHMNEGHSAFLGLALLVEEMRARGCEEIDKEVLHAVRVQCVFTTHTPVPAGHDQFSVEQVREILGHHEEFFKRDDLYGHEGRFNMTYLALNLSHYVNGVAKRHGEVSQLMFAGYEIDSITNGVHAETWVCPPMRGLLDRWMPGWRKDAFILRSALAIPDEEIWRAHQGAKKQMCEVVERETGEVFSLEVLTLGFARRATSYKRPKLLFEDKERLFQIAAKAGGMQLVFAGKAHPGDEMGKFYIQEVFQMRKEFRERGIKLVYLQDYGMSLAGILVGGVDVWLNTPQPPMEASGTSGMKAALNGVPSLSVLDGWWVEGCVEGVTGWAVEGQGGDAAALYEKLEEKVVPLYCERRHEFIEVMRHAMALNGSFFNTQRMMLQYVARAYFVDP